jgi:hypothetical protein
MSAWKRYSLSLVVLAMALAWSTSSARAASPHFVGAVKANVDLQDEEVTVSGKIAGLGNQDVVITVEVAGSADVFFVNKGGKEAPGQNKAPFQSLGSTVLRPDAKNGSVTFTLTVDLSKALDDLADSVEPPNANWTTAIRNVQITGIRVTVEQPAGTVVLQKTLTP